MPIGPSYSIPFSRVANIATIASTTRCHTQCGSILVPIIRKRSDNGPTSASGPHDAGICCVRLKLWNNQQLITALLWTPQWQLYPWHRCRMKCGELVDARGAQCRSRSTTEDEGQARVLADTRIRMLGLVMRGCTLACKGSTGEAEGAFGIS